MERKIGEIFELGSEWYQCLESPTCNCKHCDFYDNKHDLCHISPQKCLYRERSDKKDVIFKKLEKVGEPFKSSDFDDRIVMLQSYKMLTIPYISGVVCYIHYDTNIIDIEIKQTKENMGDNDDIRPYDELFSPGTVSNTKYLAKEDMEEKKQKWGVSSDTINEINKGIEPMNASRNIDTKRSEAEGIRRNLKPFNLESAKAGKPVCTRDGRKARIICFDRIDSTGCNLSIVALIQCEGTEVLQLYRDDGKRGVKADLDLMMLPEKKEGWVNVYKGGLLDTKSYNTRKEAFDKACPRDYVDTVKINWSE